MPSAIRETKQETITRVSCDLADWAEIVCHVNVDPEVFVLALSRLLAALAYNISRGDKDRYEKFISLVVECIQVHADSLQKVQSK